MKTNFTRFFLFATLYLIFSCTIHAAGGDKAIEELDKRLSDIEKQNIGEQYQIADLKKEFQHLKDLNSNFEKNLGLKIENFDTKIDFFLSVPAVIIAVLSFFGGGWVLRQIRKYEKSLQKYEIKFNELRSNIEADFERMQQEWTEKFEHSKNEMDKIQNEVKINTLITAANKLLSEKEYQEALEKYDAALEIDRKDINTLISKGNCYIALERYKEALLTYNQVLKLDPDNFKAHHSKAKCFFVLREFEKSLEAVDKAIELKPELKDAQSNKASVLDHLGRSEEAIEIYSKLLQSDPDNPKYLEGQAISLLKLNRHPEALEMYSKALSLAPKKAITLLNYMEAMLFCGHRVDEKNIKPAISSMPKTPGEELIFNFLQAIDKKIHNENTMEFDTNFNEMIKKEEKIKINWHFGEMISWCNKSNISSDASQYIKNLITRIEKEIKK